MKINAFNLGVPRQWLHPKIYAILKSAQREVQKVDKKKLLMRINLIIAIVTTCFMQVSASGFAQLVTINQKNVSLKQVFKQVRQQSGYNILYDVDLLKETKPVSVNIKAVSVADAMKQILQNQQLSFTIKDRTIILEARNTSFLEKVADLFTAPITVKGRVVDSLGRPLPGASVKVKGVKLSTSTNANGEFVLEGVEQDAILVISFIGYKQKEIRANTGLGEIKMMVQEGELDTVEVMVYTGYQKLPKERATGAFDVVDKKTLETPAISLANKLVGAVSGLQPSFSSNGGVSFVLRGQGSFSGSEPLLVVDGFAINGGFSSINPDDVESVSVLKDAAAASIWGARASNGVIVVTTKKAKKTGKLSIDFANQFKIGSNVDLDYLRNLASTEQTIAYERATFGKYQYKRTPGTLGPNDLKDGITQVYTQAQNLYNRFSYNEITAEQLESGLKRLEGYDNSQQIKDNLLQRPINQLYTLSISSPSERMSNHVSLLYGRDRDAFVGNKGQNMQLDYRGQASLFPWLDLSISSMMRYNNSDNSGVSSGDVKALHRYDMLLDENGNRTDMSYLKYNKPLLDSSVPQASFPYSNWTYNILDDMNTRSVKSNGLNIRMQTGLDFKLGYGLVFETKLMFEKLQNEGRSLYYEDSYLVRNLVNTTSTWNKTTGAVRLNIPKGSILDETKSVTNAYNWRNQINFNRTFNKVHEINFLAGAEIIQRKSTGSTPARTYGYNDDQLTVGLLPNGTGTGLALTNWLGSALTIPHRNSYSYGMQRYFSTYSNAAYTYNNKYTLSGSFRIDASNFISDDPKYRYSPFWSVGGSWNILQENFLTEITAINLLKFRATYGYNGASNTTTSVKPLITVNGTNALSGYPEASIHSYGNPDLRWERTGTLNVAVDYALFDHKLFGKLDYYRKHSKDILAVVAIPLLNGSSSALFNSAEIVNNGVEFEFGSRFRNSQGFRWEGTFNVAYNKNEVKKLFLLSYRHDYLTKASSGSTYVQGRPIDAVYSYRYAGLHNFGTDAAPTIRPAIHLKNGEFLDMVGGRTTLDGLEFMEYQGVSVAPYTLGMRHFVGYKDFDLSFSVIAKLGHIYRRTPFNFSGQNGAPNAMLTEAMYGDPNTTLPALPFDAADALYSGMYTPYMDYLKTNAGHLRINDITFSYNLKNVVANTFRLERAQVFGQVNNITIKGQKEDPEFRYGGMRLLPSFVLGVKVGF